MTTDRPGSPLGSADLQERWWGVPRHRLALVALCAALAVDALVRRSWRECEWPAVAVCATMALASPSGHSWGERVVVEAKFHLRRRLSWVRVGIDAEAIELDVRGARRVWCYELLHRGRLDLADHDTALAGRLAHLADSLADAGDGAHLAVHVQATGDGRVSTTLSVTRPVAPPAEWRRSPRSGVARGLSIGRTPVVERRDHVRTARGVARTLRVASFAPGRDAQALAALSEKLSWLTLSLHASVLPASRARRMTSRAVHRMGSDAQLARSAGFRWSARREFEFDALRQREQVVAGGAALCRWALYVVVHATSLAQLRSRVDQAQEIARTAGLRLDAGVSMQAAWFTFQLPGGPGW